MFKIFCNEMEDFLKLKSCSSKELFSLLDKDSYLAQLLPKCIAEFLLTKVQNFSSQLTLVSVSLAAYSNTEPLMVQMRLSVSCNTVSRLARLSITSSYLTILPANCKLVLETMQQLKKAVEIEKNATNETIHTNLIL